MKVGKLKKILIRKCTVNGGIIAGLLFVFYAISATESSLQDDLDSLTKDSAYIRSDITTSQEKNVQILQAIESYKTLPENKISSSGLEDLVSRIRTARTLKERLEVKYRLQGLNVKFTPIEDFSQRMDARNFAVYANNIEVKFLAPTDEIALSFCDALMKEMPGYVSIRKLDISKKGELTQDIIAKLRARSTSTPYLVEASAVFNWLTIGNKKEAQAQNNPGEGAQ